MITSGRILNRYRIEELLGQGGFGAVYRARHIHLDTTVAIKETVSSSPEQFEREAKLLASLKHPALPTVTDYFDEAERYYLVMQYVEGENLDEYVKRRPKGRLGEAEALRLIAPIVEALEYLHSQNPPVVHRDIKPNNIRITPDGRLLLVDFGLAKAYNPTATSTISVPTVTPGFSPEEQYRGKTEPRSDLYALGATLYYMLTGTVPPDALERTSKDTLVPLRRLNPSVSVMLEETVGRLLAVKLDDRSPNVVDLRRDLQRFSPTPPTVIAGMPAWRLTLIAGIGLALLLLFGGMAFVISQISGRGQPTQTPASAATDQGLTQSPSAATVIAPTQSPSEIAQNTQLAQAQTATVLAQATAQQIAQAQTATVLAQATAQQIAQAQTTTAQVQAATTQTQAAAATAETIAAEPRLQEARGWNPIFSDDFKQASRNWATREYTDTEVQVSPNINGGVYRWSINKAARPFYPFSALVGDPGPNFYISVEAKQINGLSNTMYGLVLRASGPNNNKNTAYFFMIRDDKQFAFYRYDTGTKSVFNLLKSGRTEFILPKQNNRIEIIANNNSFLFFVHDHYVGQYTDENNQLASGTLGVWMFVEVNTSNTVVEFDNYEVRVPPQ